MKNTTSKVKLSRALGIPLSPKAVRPMERRPFGPGQHGRARKRVSDYKAQLLEKQRLRAQYNVGEAQLRRAVARSMKSPGKTGEALVADLETRLDALVLRSGFARTIYQARQLVAHGHFTVNGRRVDKPSFRLRPGDEIAVHEGSRDLLPFLVAANGEHAERVPEYLDVSTAGLTARLVRRPRRDEIPIICNEQLVVEYYAR